MRFLLQARIYRSAADRMPKLLLLAGFGKPSTVHSIQNFMEQWEKVKMPAFAIKRSPNVSDWV